MGYRVIKRLRGFVLGCLTVRPANEVVCLVRLGPGAGITVDVGQQRAGRAMPQVGNALTKGFELVVSQPFGELGAADLMLGLVDGFAKLQG